jgi:gas vesicle protein GvpO
MALREATQDAVREFTALLGKSAYGVTGVRRTDGGGWSILVDVVELERIPQSTNLLATYRVDIDEDGLLVSYERLRRFTLGAADPT